MSAFREAGAEIAWAVDVEPARATALGAGQATSDYRRALNDRQLDAVSICLPHNLHAEVAVAAAEARKHVLVEKPIAATLEEADRMIEAAEREGVVLMVAENARFDPLLLRVKRLLGEGVIGAPALAQVTRQCYLRASFMKDRRWFLDARAAAGGIMTSGGVHDFEKLRMLMGEVESVYALRAPQRFLEMEGDDTSIAAIRFMTGAVCTLVESFIMKSIVTAAGPEVHTLRIDGGLGSLSNEGDRLIRLFSEQPGQLPAGELRQHELYVPDADTFELEIAHFIGCCRSGREPLTSGRSQRRPLELVLAAYRSMETGQAVKV